MSLSGARSRIIWWVISAAILLISLFVLISCTSTPTSAPEPTPTIAPPDQGDIQIFALDRGTKQSVNGVVVRVTNSSVVDGVDHRELRLQSCEQGQFLVVSAPGYETSFTPCNGSNAYYFYLDPLSTEDNINYIWSPAYGGCNECHDKQLSEGYNEVDEWEQTAHAKVFVDPFFATLYRGMNTSGQTSAPGFKLDQPNEAGNCAYCHAPSTIPASLALVDLSSYYPRPAGVSGEGVTCDVCHKVVDVTLDNDKYPLPENPGVLSFKFRRISTSFVMGPFSNILLSANNESNRHSPSSCTPILSSSQFCAACHYAKFNGMQIYNSYGEWRESRYGKNPRQSTYKTCQDCHMSHMDVKNDHTPLSLRSACFETSEAFQNFDHNLMDVGPDASGNEIPRMIQNAARLEVKLKYMPGENSIRVRVEVENMKAGHKFPTDSPLRHLILVVSAADQFESPLAHLKGDTIPDWAGDPAKSQFGVKGYAGLPGTIFANLLAEEISNLSPTAAYWNQTRYASVTDDGKTSDTRLSPREPQKSDYFFTVPDLGDIHVTVQLIYRYGFFDLMDQKGWNRPDIVVVTADCRVPVDQADDFECPEVQP